MPMNEPYYLITGGAGFIGGHLAASLAERGEKVTVLDDLSTGRVENLPSSVQLMRGSITDTNLDWAMFGASGVFHLAAIASVSACEADRARSQAVNAEGTKRVMQGAANAGIPIVYLSSAAVYGDNPNLPLKEWEAPQPLGAYGLDKLAGEGTARLLATQQNLCSVGVRPFNVYGPRQDPSSPYSGVISVFARRLREGRPITLFGDGGQTRDFIYVGDLVGQLTAAMEALHHGRLRQVVLNGCTGHSVSIRALAETMMRVAGREVPLEFAPMRAGDIRHSQGDAELAAETLGWRAQTDLAEGLKHLWESE